jgi:hypothetical protein
VERKKKKDENGKGIKLYVEKQKLITVFEMREQKKIECE